MKLMEYECHTRLQYFKAKPAAPPLHQFYGRAPLSMPAATLHYKASGASDEKAFTQRLLELIKTSPTVPLPADFRKAQAKAVPSPDQAVLA